MYVCVRATELLRNKCLEKQRSNLINFCWSKLLHGPTVFLNYGIGARGLQWRFLHNQLPHRVTLECMKCLTLKGKWLRSLKIQNQNCHLHKINIKNNNNNNDKRNILFCKLSNRASLEINKSAPVTFQHYLHEATMNQSCTLFGKYSLTCPYGCQCEKALHILRRRSTVDELQLKICENMQQEHC